MKKYSSLIIFTFCLLLFSFQTYADAKLNKGATYEGKVVKIADGDTLTLLLEKTQYKIRLAQIDTPEKGQPYGQKAKQALGNMVFNKLIKVKIETIDRYGRYVADIYLDKKHVNAELVKAGAAWVYRKYSNNKVLILLEQDAKKNKIGLWGMQEDQIMAPWEWRKFIRTNPKK